MHVTHSTLRNVVSLPQSRWARYHTYIWTGLAAFFSLGEDVTAGCCPLSDDERNLVRLCDDGREVVDFSAFELVLLRCSGGRAVDEGLEVFGTGWDVLLHIL